MKIGDFWFFYETSLVACAMMFGRGHFEVDVADFDDKGHHCHHPEEHADKGNVGRHRLGTRLCPKRLLSFEHCHCRDCPLMMSHHWRLRHGFSQNWRRKGESVLSNIRKVMLMPWRQSIESDFHPVYGWINYCPRKGNQRIRICNQAFFICSDFRWVEVSTTESLSFSAIS